ncbi:MAG TPA: short-chain dehydrogenase, partial [Paenibacillaceae bacterium]|nr:short-chain dehydrogenase [Paenibacillaceae bacterium]
MAENKKEKVVVLTGGNQGIGYFLSTSLLKKGYRVAVLDLTGDNLGPILHFQKEQFLFF